MAPRDSGGRSVLIAYDGSLHPRAAVEPAGSLLRPTWAVVIRVWTSMVHVVPVARLGAPAPVALAAADRLDAAARDQAGQLAAEDADLARRAGLEADSSAVESEGSAWHGIVRYVNELDAAVVVAGTRGRSGVAAALLASSAHGLLHHARRPVLVVSGD